MTVLVSHLWPGLAVAALLGFAFSAVFGAGAGLPSAILPVRIGVGAILVAAGAISALGLVPGRSGLWFDIVTLCAFAYAAGTALGLLTRALVRRGRDAEPGAASPPASAGQG